MGEWIISLLIQNMCMYVSPMRRILKSNLFVISMKCPCDFILFKMEVCDKDEVKKGQNKLRDAFWAVKMNLLQWNVNDVSVKSGEK